MAQFNAPCTLTFDDDGSTAALTLVPDTPNVAVDGEEFLWNAPGDAYRTRRNPATGVCRTLVRNSPPADPNAGNLDGRNFTLGE